jgi:hypothetical protein
VLFELRHSILASVDKHAKDIFTPLIENGYSIFTLDGRTLATDELENPSDADYLAAVNPAEYVPHLGTSTAPVC